VIREMSKRLRRKSRKLSEAEQDEIEPPKKRGRPSSSSPLVTTPEEKSSKTLVVSLQNSTIGTRFMSRLQKRSTSSRTLKKTESPSSSSKDDSINGGATPTAKDSTPTIKFKNPKFSFSFVDMNKKRTWKGLKQIIQAEKSTKLDPDTPTYGHIDAPPPFKPPRKYSDISGLLWRYTDPLTSLYFNAVDEFETIRTLPSNIIQGYLSLRGKATIT
jgi:INO80 complex subunit C